MFNNLSEKLEQTFKNVKRRGKLTPQDLDETINEIKTSLLEADVNIEVAKNFCAEVKENAIGQKLEKSLTPGQQIVDIVYQCLVKAMGEHSELNLRFTPPVIIMLVGLQGSGKTTSCGKLAKHLLEKKLKPILVPADVYRPAAIEQLHVLGKDLGVEVFDSKVTDSPVDIAKRGFEYAKNSGFDALILDTAGRLQIDDVLMNELADIVDEIDPHEVLLVADAMTGQEAVNVAKTFDDILDIDGIILTKLDGDARAGAALSMRAITGKPIKYIGMGEKLDALEPFYPERIASRILGMGDVLTLVEKARQQVNEDDAKKLQKKFKKNQFTLEDFYSQLQSIQKMGSMSSLMGMIPGTGKISQQLDDEEATKGMKRLEAIIQSMTLQERRHHEILNGSRRRRIAIGSGTTVEEVNALIKQFTTMRKMMKKFTNMGPKAMNKIQQMIPGS